MNTDFFYVWFRILCFTAFLVVAFRMIKQKMFPQLKSLYATYKNFLSDKIKNKERLQQQKQHLLDEILLQKKLAVRLSEQIEIWKEKENIRILRQQKEIHSIHERLRVYMIEQAHCFAVSTTRKELVPEINEKLLQAVSIVYSQLDEQQRYMTHLMNRLQENRNE